MNAEMATGLGSKLSLLLTGRMPGVILFPLMNGRIIILSLLASIAFFGEKPGKRGIAGIVAGMAAFLLLALK